MKFPFVIIARTTLELLNQQLAEVKQERQWLLNKLMEESAPSKRAASVEEDAAKDVGTKPFTTAFESVLSSYDRKYPTGTPKDQKFIARLY